MSATNRRRGHEWERELARWFRDHGFDGVRTAREADDGFQRGTDLVTVHDGLIFRHVNGWVVEAKDVQTPAVKGWMDQAADDAGGGPFAVVWKRRHHGPGEARVWLPASWGGWLLGLCLPAECRRVQVDLWTFTAALLRWEPSLDDSKVYW